jgi:hypothetical protein
MPINAGLINALSRPVRSVQDYQDDYTRQDLRDQGMQRNALMMQESQANMANQADLRAQAAAQRNALSAAYGSLKPGATQADIESALFKNPLTVQRGYELQKDRVANEKLTAETAGLNQKRGIEGDQQARLLLQSAKNPTMASDMVRSAVEQKLWTPERGQSVLDGMPIDLTQWDEWRNRQLAPAMAPKDILPTSATRNTGGSTDTLSIDTFSGIPSVTGSVRNTQSPDNKASVGASYANAAAVRDQAQAVRDAAKITTRASDETGLRKEFADLPEVKKYKNAIPAYQSIVKAAKINNPQADINLIYGLAKLYDPDSVVREGEYDTIANSQSIPEWLKGQAQRLAGGGRLTEETKSQIIQQAGIRVSAYESEVSGAQASYDKIARGRGLDPSNVFPAVGGQLAKPSGGMPDMSAIDAEIARRRKGK